MMNLNKPTQTALAVLIVIAASGAIALGINGMVETQPTPTIVHTLAPKPTPVVPVHDTYTSNPNPSLTVVPTATMRYSDPLTPPNFTQVFQLVDPAHHYLASGGTTYYVTHSLAQGYGAPGNAWEKLTVGETVEANGHLWLIDYTATPAKGTLQDQPIWGANDPNLLVMITCISKGPGIPASNNYVIRAERIN